MPGKKVKGCVKVANEKGAARKGRRRCEGTEDALFEKTKVRLLMRVRKVSYEEALRIVHAHGNARNEKEWACQKEDGRSKNCDFGSGELTAKEFFDL